MDGYNIYNIVLTAIFSVVILGIFWGAGKNRKIIVFRDYDNLGLTFLIPTAFFGIIFLFHIFGGNPLYSTVLAGVIYFILLIILVKNSYADNNRVIWKLLFWLPSYHSLFYGWLIYFHSLNQVVKQRRESRATALLVLTTITPIIGILVVDKHGEPFSPRQWIKGKRVGNIQNHM